MRRKNRITTAMVCICVACCSVLSTGCLIGENLTITTVIPVGLAGTPGLLNPFGIVQAFVNAALSNILGTGSTSSSSGSSTSSTITPSPTPSVAAIGAAVSQAQTQP